MDIRGYKSKYGVVSYDPPYITPRGTNGGPLSPNPSISKTNASRERWGIQDFAIRYGSLL